MDTLLARAGEIKQPKRRETLITFRDQILLSRQLVTLTCDAPAPEPIDDFVVRHPDPEVLGAFLDEMEFRSLRNRVGDGVAPAKDGTAFVVRPKPLTAPVMTPRYAPKAATAPVVDQTFDLDAYVCIQTIEALDASSQGRPRRASSASTPRPRPSRRRMRGCAACRWPSGPTTPATSP